ncbi:hypothetical protein GCM10014715_79360 [Streptomyces spiralis]|uniref:Uncharacterized protein n=2 Tax=Streptomyces spiralis TaxID=66376 RepID=A0A919E4C8_9ACTN|nr:hypothetical protein GCM10014715_79360 [Streptomyces spiralis]
MAVAELDVSRDEDLSYATRLQASGVPVELALYSAPTTPWTCSPPKPLLSTVYFRAWFRDVRRQFSACQP